MDENEQYSPREFYYSIEETEQNANFRWEEPEARQGCQGVIVAFLIGQKAETSVQQMKSDLNIKSTCYDRIK